MTVCEHCEEYLEIIKEDLIGMIINGEKYYICHNCLRELIKQKEENE